MPMMVQENGDDMDIPVVGGDVDQSHTAKNLNY
jgi:hypothetical protein